ncbi:DNA cytosine methyltransferase [Janthinobacterium sp. J1-1]|uniref:DNA cytosine methyltransferase n=1 Tax=Janthinobacterium sp. J1-1 TaxID=3065910 RepID=UPI0028110817|nr:DNA cytosine methyltransferase [Janthinobacterium sp. J1-1]
MSRELITSTREFRHFHFCCGLGGGKQGFNAAQPQVGSMAATLRCIGGIDNDPAAIRDFDRAGPGRPGTVMDLFTRAQYTAFHGKEPPAGWREATAVDIRRAAGNESPNIVFISSPCKGASGLLSETLSKTAKYQALNELTLRCIWLMCEAWADNPVDLIVFENVPRLATRGRHLLDQINQLLQQFGYAVAETTHDCGELGGLAQSRKRFLLVARHMEKVPPFLYEPERKRLRAVGDVLGRMPFPGDAAGGPMHRIPRLQWKTWVRLAFVEAGSDWRSLNKLAVEDGYLSEYLILPERSHDYLGVNAWDEHVGAVSGRGTPTTGAYSVADPRMDTVAEYSQYGVMPWGATSGVVSAQSAPGGGRYSVADPRPADGPTFSKYAVTRWEKQSGTVIGGGAQGACAVADPRSSTGFGGKGKYLVTPFDANAGVVIAESTTGHGAFCVADPRAINRQKGDAFLTGGHYGVLPWDGQSGAVSASAGYDNGRWSIADPRIDEAPQLPALNQKTVALIRALDGTWHRPFTTLELGALQSLIDPDEHWSTDPKIQREIDEHKRRTGASAFPLLDGTNDSAHRERIGNAVPKLAAQAIGEVMGTTLLLAAAGETFMLSAMPIWVQPVAIAIAASQGPTP